MSDWYQAILSNEVISAAQAQRQGAEIAAWLIGEGIIEDRQCNGCRDEGLCYPPGPHVMRACGAIESDAINGNDAGPAHLVHNGMRLAAGRSVIYNMQGQYQPVPCPRCAGLLANQVFLHAGGDWLEGKIESLVCPHCGQGSALPHWIDPDTGFVMLAFEFANWPPLSDAFIESIARRLGHCVSLITGKS